MNTILYQQKILELAVEDVYGLWEILWGLQSEFPNGAQSELRREAESALRELLRKGWVCVLRRNSTTDEAIQLQPAEASAALADQSNWDEPGIDSAQIVVGATAEGERAYYCKELIA
jgi:hypothetical protein